MPEVVCIHQEAIVRAGDAENLVNQVQEEAKAEQEEAKAAVEALRDDLEQSKQDAQLEQDALAKRNKMIMFGAGIVILILILKKK